MPMLDTNLIFDGAKKIPRKLTFCESCGEWLASSSDRKQADELIAAIRLVAAAPELAGSRLEHADKPDIRVHLGGQIYGLEVTRIARGGEDVISRARWRRVVERTARLLWRERNDSPVWVSLMWHPDPPRTNVQTLARQLVELVERYFATLPPKIHAWRNVDPGQIPNELAPYVRSLHVLRTRKDDHWVSGFSGNPDVQPQELQDEIDRKARKAVGYSPPEHGLWLLIYAETSNAAQALDLNDEARSASYSGPFDRVFFLDCMDKAADLRLAKVSGHLTASCTPPGANVRQ
jgi:hypothetical protein